MHKAPMQHPPASIFQPSSYGPPMSYGLPGTGAPPVTAAEEAGVGAGGEPVREQELPWGPEHPCYPHMNPHVPIASSEYFTTRIIRIRRDWMIRGDLAPTFSNLYPEILDPMLPEHEFRKVIAHLNATLIDVYSPTDLRNWLDGMLGFLTGWLWEDAGHTAIKRGLAELEEWIKAWNETTGVQQGVKIWPLRNTGPKRRLLERRILNIRHLLFHPSLLCKRWPDVWRLVTPFFVASPGVQLLLDLYFLYSYGSQLEKGAVRFATPGSFLVYVLFIGAVVLVLAGGVLGGVIFASAFHMAFIYTWAADNVGAIVTLYVVQLRAEYLPWALLFITWLGGSSAQALVQATGIAAAYAYDYLTRVYPAGPGAAPAPLFPGAATRAGSVAATGSGAGRTLGRATRRRNWLHPPAFVQRWFQPRGFSATAVQSLACLTA
ncbi:hypothetical protein KEM52_001848 [Ascosphaera acerosa]|nr:hypothetical protein KEM52_001848 [Ascosphaera acerosa]